MPHARRGRAARGQSPAAAAAATAESAYSHARGQSPTTTAPATPSADLAVAACPHRYDARRASACRGQSPDMGAADAAAGAGYAERGQSPVVDVPDMASKAGRSVQPQRLARG